MIVGTAGHIDHGKTALVKALTGVDADRLAEEKARGISIDLGFAYLPRPDGSVMGFVDVPGHERFMKTMLAGATGIDFVLLVVAADDGIMPQTREHLAVVELLGLEHGATVLTKCDLVEEDRLAALEGEVGALLAGRPLADVPVFRTSSVTGQGIEALLGHLDAAAAVRGTASGEGAFRMVVDRSFTLQGTGTVVTGVVWSGSLAVGDTVTISPAGFEARVRALHVQNRPSERAMAGERCGVNLGRVEARAVARGDFLLAPALHAPTDRLDAELRLLPAEPRPLRHWSAVRLHHGAAEVGARVALLQDEPLQPGTTGLVQLVLDRPIAAAAMDRFVLRSQDATRTMGGGRLIDLRPPHRRRKQPQRLAQLAAMAVPDAAASLALQLDRWPWFVDRVRFIRDRALGPAAADAVLGKTSPVAAQAGGEEYLFGRDAWTQISSGAVKAVETFHQRFPQILGPSLARLLPAMSPRLPKGAAQAALERLVADELLAREAGIYRLPSHRLSLDRQDAALWAKAEPLLGGPQRFRPPRIPDLAAALSLRDFDLRRVLKAMARQGRTVEIAPDHFFLRDTLVEAAGLVADLAEAGEGGAFGAADLRDRLEEVGGTGVGRKVAIQMLEHFDRHGLTLRRGDQRTIDPRRIARYRSGDEAGG